MEIKNRLSSLNSLCHGPFVAWNNGTAQKNSSTSLSKKIVEKNSMQYTNRNFTKLTKKINF